LKISLLLVWWRIFCVQSVAHLFELPLNGAVSAHCSDTPPSQVFSLARARHRARQLGLTNVRVCLGDVNSFSEPFTFGVAVHFCGSLTDMALDACLRMHAAYVAQRSN